MTAPSEMTVAVVGRDRRDPVLGAVPRHEAPAGLVDKAWTDGPAGPVRAAS